MKSSGKIASAFQDRPTFQTAIQATVEGKGFEMDTVPGEGACSGNCQSCPYLDFDSGFPGETLTCCKLPGHERILDVDFDVSAVI